MAAVVVGGEVGVREEAEGGGADGRPGEAQATHRVLQGGENAGRLQVEEEVAERIAGEHAAGR
eukprot:675078-Lingulodinium_polyedra.AAC.1